MAMKEIPIPVRAIGPGSQPDEDAVLDMIHMPSGMEMYRPPVLDDRLLERKVDGARRLLAHVTDTLGEVLRDGALDVGLPAGFDTRGLSDDDRALLAQVLGEGEVSASVATADGPILIQESVFAGVWSVVGEDIGHHVELAAVPAVVRAGAAVASRDGDWRSRLHPGQAAPAGAWTAPSLLTEIETAVDEVQPGDAPRVINLTLLPMGPDDGAWLDACLGVGAVDILSRGYGNCRIQSTRIPDCWRVVYFNSQDKVILDTIEIIDVPSVACAAREDFEDTHERLVEVLQWIEGASQ